jgi:FMN phosphatase YigB (HAD superfamily)
LGVRPKEALFVDDNMENVKRALNQGLRAIHFKKARDLQMEIKKFFQMP